MQTGFGRFEALVRNGRRFENHPVPPPERHSPSPSLVTLGVPSLLSNRVDEEMKMTHAFKKPLTSSLAMVAVLTLTVVFPGLSAADPRKNPESTTDRAPKDDAQVRLRYAVAYSGYRAGQHPDQGEGAANPTEEQVLEDLRILTRDLNFGLIRLYDSGEHARTVLKVIREHQLPLKVMSGIWLSAEISNHQGCPWLDERIPDEVLEKNKKENKLEIDRGIKLANEYQDVVIAVSVGNEALVSWTDHKVDVDKVIKYVKKVKRSISQRVTVAENFAWWAESGKTPRQGARFHHGSLVPDLGREGHRRGPGVHGQQHREGSRGSFRRRAHHR